MESVNDKNFSGYFVKNMSLRKIIQDSNMEMSTGSVISYPVSRPAGTTTRNGRKATCRILIATTVAVAIDCRSYAFKAWSMFTCALNGFKRSRCDKILNPKRHRNSISSQQKFYQNGNEKKEEMI